MLVGSSGRRYGGALRRTDAPRAVGARVPRRVVGSSGRRVVGSSGRRYIRNDPTRTRRVVGSSGRLYEL